MPNNGYYLSAYQIAVNHGFTGTQQDWIELLCGNYVKMMDHRNLNGREAGGAHPISAIAGLDEKLAELKESIDYPESVNKTEELVLVPITLNQTGEKLNTETIVYLPETIDISSGVWEFELYVLGLYRQNVSSHSTPVLGITISLFSSEKGKTTGYQIFGVHETEADGERTANTVKMRAIVAGGHKNVTTYGYVGNTSGITCADDITQTADTNSMVDSIYIKVQNTDFNHITNGIILRYHKIG